VERGSWSALIRFGRAPLFARARLPWHLRGTRL